MGQPKGIGIMQSKHDLKNIRFNFLNSNLLKILFKPNQINKHESLTPLIIINYVRNPPNINVSTWQEFYCLIQWEIKTTKKYIYETNIKASFNS